MLQRMSIFTVVLFVFIGTAGAELSEIPTQSSGVEALLKIEASGGAEKEAGANAGGRGAVELLGVLPIGERFGIQGIGHYVGGSGSRYGLSAGPLFDWGSGKTGLFIAYQHRSHNDNNFVHLRPSASFYMPQANINIFYSHPVSSPQHDGGSVEYGVNHLQGTFNYFPASDWTSFMRKDNVELALGIQFNSFAGAGSRNISNGVGPVFGLSFMLTNGLEVNLVKGTVDHHGRYRVATGLSFNFTKKNATLKEIRRHYLEPNLFSPNGAAAEERCGGNPASHNLGGCNSAL